MKFSKTEKRLLSTLVMTLYSLGTSSAVQDVIWNELNPGFGTLFEYLIDELIAAGVVTEDDGERFLEGEAVTKAWAESLIIKISLMSESEV